MIFPAPTLCLCHWDAAADGVIISVSSTRLLSSSGHPRADVLWSQLPAQSIVHRLVLLSCVHTLAAHSRTPHQTKETSPSAKTQSKTREEDVTLADIPSVCLVTKYCDKLNRMECLQ